MLLAFHQPNYLPNLSYFYKMAQVDIFIVTTNLQFMRREWQSRAKLKMADKDLLLTVPVRGSNRQMIREVLIDKSSQWQVKHSKTLESLYHKTAQPEILNSMLSFYQESYTRLVDLNVALIFFIKDVLNIKTPVIIDEEVGGKKHELLINICDKYGADCYLSGVGGKLYMTEDYIAAINKRNIKHRFVEHNVTFEFPYSAIHYILGESLSKSCDIIKGNI